MGAIDLLLSSPIPVVISIFLNAAACAAGWWFVLPLLERERALRVTNEKLSTDAIDSAKKTADAIALLSQSIEQIRAVVERPVSMNLDAIADMQKTYSESVTTLLKEIRSTIDSDQRDTSQILSMLTNLERNSERLIRAAADISEKQSQVSGIIIGMNMQRAVPPRGV